MSTAKSLTVKPRRKVLPAKTVLGALVVVTILAAFVSLCVGRYGIGLLDMGRILMSKIIAIPRTWDNTMENVVFSIRVPRILGALFVGAALAISGATYQGVFKNPLVSPDILGVSAGACVGAAVAIISGMNTFGIQGLAFGGGILAVCLTGLIPKLLKNDSTIVLVLAGVVVGGFFSSIMGLLKYIADQETQLAAITYWQMGSLAAVKMPAVYGAAPVMLAGMIILVKIRWRINILSLGESEAKMLGVRHSVIRGVTIVCATVLTAVSVCVSGTIGWVGLVIPHLGRMLVGPDNTKLLPVSIFLGALFMVVIDTAARMLTAAEIPLSILTGTIGAPLYGWLLINQRMKMR